MNWFMVCISGIVKMEKHRALFRKIQYIYLGSMGPCSVKYTFSFSQLTILHIVSYKVSIMIIIFWEMTPCGSYKTSPRR
jgi:hypothetical protein